MKRTPLILLGLMLLLGFCAAGGLETAAAIREKQERNARAKEINQNIDKGIDLARRIWLEAYYTAQAQPLVDIPPEWRQRNWSAPTGSCVHATTISLLRWQGLKVQADEWRNRYGGGESAGPHTRKLAAMGLRYVVTTDGDERLIEWALATRRGCGVGWPAFHCVALVGRVERGGQTFAVLLDNNHTGRLTYVEWGKWLSQWKRLGGWAFAVIGKVPPPIPRSIR